MILNKIFNVKIIYSNKLIIFFLFSGINLLANARPPTTGEIALLMSMYGDKIDYSQVEVISGAGFDPRSWPPLSSGYAVTLGYTMYYPSGKYKSDFSDDLASSEWFIHEGMHIYQYANDPSYSWEKAAVEGAHGNDYAYGLTIIPGKSFNEYRFEQQAEIARLYYEALMLNNVEKINLYQGILNPLGLGSGTCR